TIFMDDLLYELKRTRNQMAILNDEYGGVVGIATLEDLLEEIVGDIDDEYDETYSMIEAINETRYLVDGSTPLSKFNEFFNTNIESNDVDSIAGFFIMQYGSIPHANEEAVVEYADYIFTSNDIEGSRLVNLFVDRIPQEVMND
ncbi:MAG: transporter associated domain-containing protein, partial [Carnobacterium sp.]